MAGSRFEQSQLSSFGQQVLLVLLILFFVLGTAGSVAGASEHIPTISIISVERGETVTIRTHNFPANRAFTVRMGPMGTRGEGGTVVATTDSGDGGSLDATYNIPEELSGAYQIAIRLEAPGGYFAYNWFFNNTTGEVDPTTPEPAPPDDAYTGNPTFRILSVERDETVTIRTTNFPADQAFTVRMGPMSTRGVGGTVIATTDSGDGGTFDSTYTIPDGLTGAYQIAIRLESPAGYFAYNWFYNNTTR